MKYIGLLRIFRALILSMSILSTLPSFAGGGIQGGGGGNFTHADFWNITRSIELTLSSDTAKVKKNLSDEEITRVSSFLNSAVTDVEFTSELLYVEDKNGQPVRVDAVNFPDKPGKKLIKLYEPYWNKKFESGYDIKHLIFHEFLGLAKIDDTNYKLSLEIFTPERQDIKFYKATEIGCSISSWIAHWSDNGQLIYRQAYGVKQGSSENYYDMVAFSSPSTRKIKEEVIQNKVARYSSPLDFRGLRHEGLILDYKVDILMSLDSESFHYGWGAAANKIFTDPAVLTVLVQLKKKENGKWVTIGSAQEQTTQSSYGSVELSFSLFNNQLMDKFSENGLNISVSQKTEKYRDIFGPFNFINILDEYTEHLPSQSEKDLLIKKTVFKGLPNNIPVSTNITCMMKNN